MLLPAVECTRACIQTKQNQPAAAVGTRANIKVVVVATNVDLDVVRPMARNLPVAESISVAIIKRAVAKRSRSAPGASAIIIANS